MAKIKIRGFEEHVTIPVKVDLLDDEVKLKVQYKRIDKQQMEKIVKDASERATEARDLQTKKILSKDPEEIDKIDKRINELDELGTQLLLDRVVSWSEFEDEDKEEVPFSEEMLKLLLGHPAYLMAFDQGMWQATGAAIKN